MILEEIAEIFWVMDYIPDGVMLISRDLKIVFWNSVLEDWTGIMRDKILNHSLVENYPHLNDPKYKLRLSDIFKGGPPAIFSSQLHGSIIPCKINNNQCRIQQTTVEAITVKTMEGFFALFVIQDVTDLTNKLLEQKKTEKQLITAGRVLEKQKQELLDFASSISHDLRNSFTIINGFLGLLQEDQKPRYFELIQKQINLMQNLLERSLRLAEAGIIVEKKSVVDLFKLINEIAELTVPENVGFRNDLRIFAKSDNEKLKQVLKNLLENAVTHAKPRNIDVKSQHVEGGVEILISNDGITIPSEILSKIFNRGFSTAGTSGIGLSIVKKIIDALNWTISAESDSKLTCFNIFVPNEDIIKQ